jgi:hypothetical protein
MQLSQWVCCCHGLLVLPSCLLLSPSTSSGGALLGVPPPVRPLLVIVRTPHARIEGRQLEDIWRRITSRVSSRRWHASSMRTGASSSIVRSGRLLFRAHIRRPSAGEQRFAKLLTSSIHQKCYCTPDSIVKSRVALPGSSQSADNAFRWTDSPTTRSHRLIREAGRARCDAEQLDGESQLHRRRLRFWKCLLRRDGTRMYDE